MGERILELCAGFSSAFNMSPGAYERPEYLSSSRRATDELALDWQKLCDDGQYVLVTLEGK